MINTEYQILCITLLSITAGILLFALFGIGAVKWASDKVADIFFGRVPGGRK